MKKLLLLAAVSLSCLNSAVQAMEATPAEPSKQLIVRLNDSEVPTKIREKLEAQKEPSKQLTVRQNHQQRVPEISPEIHEKVVAQLSVNPLVRYLIAETYKEITSKNPQGTPAPHHDLLRRIVLEDPSSLASIMKTCKDWSIATKDFQEATTAFFNKIYQGHCALNSWFTPSHNYKTKDGKYHNNAEAFKAGFKQLIFKLGTEKREYEVLFPTHQTLRHYLFEETTKFPKKIKDDFPHLFEPQIPDKPLQFSYVKAFCLYRDQKRIESYPLEQFYTCLKGLSSYIKENKISSEDLESLRTLHTCSQVEKFKPLYASVLSLWRLALIAQNSSQKFFNFPPSLKIAEEMQKIPVNLSTIGTDIEQLQQDIEKQILDLAQERWKTVQQLKLYSMIG